MHKLLRFVSIIGFILISSVAIFAQEVPKYELFTGYSAVRMNEFTTYNGLAMALTRNFNKSFGMVGEIAGYSNSKDDIFTFNDFFIRSKSSSKLFTYMAGPRFSIRSNSRFTPYGQALFGGYRISENFSSQVNSSTFKSKNVVNSFAATAGAGVDITVNKRISVKAAQIDYLFLRKTNNDNLRVSSGLAFKF